MNSRILILTSLAAASALNAQTNAASTPPSSPPIVQAFPREASPIPKQGPNQRIYGPAGGTLIAREAANGVLEGFRKVYVTDGAPRVVIYVNRALADASDTGKAAEPNAAMGGNSPVSAPTSAPALADQQTVREIERLFGRAFRHGGAQLADYKVAAALLPEQPGASLIGAQAAKEREALAKVADIAIEVLISSRNLVVAEVSGDATYTVPDIQATAIRLKDAAIVGKAAASDILGKGAQAGQVARRFDASDVTEATALALMEDMLTGMAKP